MTSFNRVIKNKKIMQILLIDNFDSFTYNLVHYLEGQDANVTVVRNDAIQLDQVQAYDKIVLSPGPGLPKDAGMQPELIRRFVDQKPILGVCLGLQALVEHFGGQLFNQEFVKHGVAEKCMRNAESSKLFAGIPDTFAVGLYHSWAAEPEKFPAELAVTARSENGIIMAFEHQTLPVCGVQFHPESVLTEYGHQLIGNFLRNF
jgi:anthranilate synthase component II